MIGLLGQSAVSGRLCLATPTGVSEERNRLLSPEEEGSSREEGRPRGAVNRMPALGESPELSPGKGGAGPRQRASQQLSSERGRLLGQRCTHSVGEPARLGRECRQASLGEGQSLDT